MRIQFDGAARTVTGSQHLLEVNGARLLLDCGLFQGRRAESYERNRGFPFDPRKLDAVLLSHAHIDHSGNLPSLVKGGFSGSIYATPPTAHLGDIMLRDSGHIQEANADSVNNRRMRKGEPPIEPLYTEADAARVEPYFRPILYGQRFEAAPGVTAQFLEAGHILGSAAIRLEVEERGRKSSLWFSGDIGRRDLPLVRDPVLPSDVDYLIMECTYGDKPHGNPLEAHREFHDVVVRTLGRGGKVIIPAFAVGRTQELVYSLHMMTAAGSIPKAPVFVDSPLAVNASQVFQKFSDYFDSQTQYFVEIGKHPALQFEGLTYVRSAEESKSLNERKEPMIIISASGMAETGRILYHLKNNIEEARNTIVIVSWQAPFTLGRRLAERERQVRIFGETYHRRAEIATIGGLSAHAGQDMLTDYALAVKGRARRIFLVHGEPRAAAALQECLRERGLTQSYYPDMRESVEVELH
jgi:metallo-beta-lactamase family protein